MYTVLVPNFRGAKYLTICNFQKFTETFFADAVNVTPSELLYKHFHTLNFGGWRLILENRSNLAPPQNLALCGIAIVVDQ